MEVLIKFDIEHRYKSIISASKRDVVPDGLFGDEPRITTVAVIKAENLSIPLCVDSFDLRSKVASVSSVYGVKLEEIGSLEEISDIVDGLEVCGWSVDVHQETLDAAIKPVSEKNSETCSDNEGSKANKPKLIDWIGSLIAIMTLSSIWYGYLAEWQLDRFDYIAPVMTAVVGSVFGQVIAFIFYKKKIRNLETNHKKRNTPNNSFPFA